jgi:hypothetical protein
MSVESEPQMTQIYDFQFAIADFQFRDKETAEGGETKIMAG